MADVFVVGDSHAAVLASAARTMGLTVLGGALADGAELEQSFFEAKDGTFRVLVQKAAGRTHNAFAGLLQFEGPILSTVGFNSHRFVSRINRYAGRVGDAAFLSSAAFVQTVRDGRAEAVRFHQCLVDHGRHVFFTCSPQRLRRGRLDILRRFEDVLIAEIQKTRARFIDVRPYILENGEIKDMYKAEDPIHGNAAWGRLVLERMFAEYGARPGL